MRAPPLVVIVASASPRLASLRESAFPRRAGCVLGKDCAFEHVHCHHCLAEGHVALGCAAFRATLATDTGLLPVPVPVGD